jgi:ABC-type nitrate/sulfonate/bicarbonate transport system permease component
MMDHSIYRHTFDSLVRWGYGFLVASAAGVFFGLAAGWWRTLDRLTSPAVQVLQLIPGLAWIPVALLLFGVGENATRFMIAITAFAPIAINVTDGVKQVDARYIRAAQMMGTKGKDLFLRVLLPGALPQIISGLRVGLGNSWRVVVAAEMVVGTGSGLGYAIVQSRWTLDFTASFACIIVIALIGLLVEQAVLKPLEKRTIRRWGLHCGDN